jgi:hypothetical protein
VLDEDEGPPFFAFCFSVSLLVALCYLPNKAMVFLNLIDVLLVMTDDLYSCGVV